MPNNTVNRTQWRVQEGGLIYVAVVCTVCKHGGAHPISSYQPLCDKCGYELHMHPCDSKGNVTGTWEELKEFLL